MNTPKNVVYSNKFRHEILQIEVDIGGITWLVETIHVRVEAAKNTRNVV